MTRSKQILTAAFLLVAANCARRPEEDLTNTAATRRAARSEVDKTHDEAMDKAGAPKNETDGTTPRLGGKTAPIPNK